MEEQEFLEPFTLEKTSSTYTVYLDGEIREAGYYRYVCEILRTSEPDDDFVFVFNTSGGNVDGMNSLLCAMKLTSSHVHGILVGEAASAGSALFLACDSFEVSPMASMMIHTASYAYGGKHTEVMSYVDSSREWIDKFINETYSDFLPSEKLQKVKNGTDIYLNSDEITEYLHNFMEIKKARIIEAAKKEDPTLQ